jgi:hypothetical protein
MEENRPRWGARTSNSGEAASLSLVGSTPALFRQLTQTISTFGCPATTDPMIVARG